MEERDTIRSHYNQISNKSIEERKSTKNFNIRMVNNFIKTCLFRKYIRKNDIVLDIGIGKGGDFQKYEKMKISELYGVDIADRSILDATIRAREGEYPFKITLKTRDAYGELLNFKKMFDVVSIQFSFHYAFVSEKNLDTAIENISNALPYDGVLMITIPSKDEILDRRKKNKLSNDFYKIDFRDNISNEIYGNYYFYSQVDSINDCIEYLVDLPTLESKFYKKEMEMVYKCNFLGFLKDEICYYPSHVIAKHNISNLTEEEKNVIDLYDVIVFRKLK